MKTLLGFSALVISAGLVMVAAARAVAGPAQEGAKALVAADLAFARSTSETGLKGWLSWFAPDAVIYPSGSPSVKGLPAIRDYYAKTGFDPSGLKWRPTEAGISEAGDLGFTSGTWEMEAKPDGRPRGLRGKYLTVWQRQKDGRYLVLADMGSTDSAPKQPGS